MHDLQHGFKEGEAVVRFRSDLTINNPAMRDFPLIRINDSEHPRQGRKYRVWPLMNFAVFVDDVEAKMTHIIRGKDHADNAKRQEMMYKTLGLPVPRTYFLGRYNFTGLDLSCSKTKAKIKEGVFSGWDDIRLPFLGALRRRGYQPEAFLKYCQKNGISPVDKVVAAEDFFKSIDAFNKEIIDPIARRHFFIPDPIEVKIEGSPVIESELDLHPQNQKGGRKFTSHGGFILSKADVDSFKEGELIRLMDCINFRKKDGKLVYESTAFEDYKGKGHKILHWLPAGGGHAMTTVLMPDNTLISGIGERYIGELKVGDIVQFERFGFCRLDSVQAGVHNFWFAHK